MSVNPSPIDANEHSFDENTPGNAAPNIAVKLGKVPPLLNEDETKDVPFLKTFLLVVDVEFPIKCPAPSALLADTALSWPNVQNNCPPPTEFLVRNINAHIEPYAPLTPISAPNPVLAIFVLL